LASLALDVTKFNFGWRSALDPAMETYDALPDPSVVERSLNYKVTEEGYPTWAAHTLMGGGWKGDIG